MKKIDLNDWIESGRGGRGASFFHKDAPDYMLKFDNLLTDPSSMEEELWAASVAYSLGISTPEPGEVVTDGKRYGLTFRRIPDKVSYAHAIDDNPERLEELAKEFAVQTRKLHAIDADTTRMRNIKDIYRSLISRNTLHGPAIISHALELLDSLPEDRTCVHGDLHFGNIILSHGKSYFIDMGNFSYGCRLWPWCGALRCWYRRQLLVILLEYHLRSWPRLLPHLQRWPCQNERRLPVRRPVRPAPSQNNSNINFPKTVRAQGS